MFNQNETSSKRQLEPTPERREFIDTNSVKRLILAAVNYRIDETGKVKPDTVVRKLTYDSTTDESPASGGKTTYQKHGTLIRTNDQWQDTEDLDGNRYMERPHNLRIDSSLYSTLKGNTIINLSETDLEKLEHDSRKLNGAAVEKGYSCDLSLEQERPAYHIENLKKSDIDFSPVRIYVPGVKAAAEIAAEVIHDSEVEISGAKVWMPRNYSGEQKFRSDTPIFIVSNYPQLASVVRKLSDMRQEGQLPTAEYTPLAGAKIKGLTGIVIGQEIVENGSFNGIIKDLFAKPIETALLENNLETGQTVTDEWLDKVAYRVQELAQQAATDYGVNSDNHAFGIGEPATEIMRVADQAVRR